jgi:hypothetical protein
MDAHRIRNVLPGIYALAVVLAVVLGSAAVVAGVAVAGAILVGLAYSALSGGGPSPNAERAARRAGRRDRRR